MAYYDELDKLLRNFYSSADATVSQSEEDMAKCIAAWDAAGKNWWEQNKEEIQDTIQESRKSKRKSKKHIVEPADIGTQFASEVKDVCKQFSSGNMKRIWGLRRAGKEPQAAGMLKKAIKTLKTFKTHLGSATEKEGGQLLSEALEAPGGDCQFIVAAVKRAPEELDDFVVEFLLDNARITASSKARNTTTVTTNLNEIDDITKMVISLGFVVADLVQEAKKSVDAETRNELLDDISNVTVHYGVEILEKLKPLQDVVGQEMVDKLVFELPYLQGREDVKLPKDKISKADLQTTKKWNELVQTAEEESETTSRELQEFVNSVLQPVAGGMVEVEEEQPKDPETPEEQPKDPEPGKTKGKERAADETPEEQPKDPETEKTKQERELERAFYSRRSWINAEMRKLLVFLVPYQDTVKGSNLLAHFLTKLGVEIVAGKQDEATIIRNLCKKPDTWNPFTVGATTWVLKKNNHVLGYVKVTPDSTCGLTEMNGKKIKTITIENTCFLIKEAIVPLLLTAHVLSQNLESRGDAYWLILLPQNNPDAYAMLLNMFFEFTTVKVHNSYIWTTKNPEVTLPKDCSGVIREPGFLRTVDIWKLIIDYNRHSENNISKNLLIDMGSKQKETAELFTNPEKYVEQMYGDNKHSQKGKEKIKEQDKKPLTKEDILKILKED